MVGEYWVDAANAHRYGGHELLNLRALWQVTPRWSAALRINNALIVITRIARISRSAATGISPAVRAPYSPR